MPARSNISELSALVHTLVKWSALGGFVGVVSGSASAVFLLSLTWATSFQANHSWLLFLLPVAGIGISLVYSNWGKSVEGGQNLLLETIHNPEAAIPFRMAPLILLSTIVTHLFGGSAGREGTAVQMGGTLATLAKGLFRLSNSDHRILIMSGISGGFGSVFGTPLAGTVFGIEAITVGRLSYEALIPCFVASVIGDIVCRSLGVHHTHLTVNTIPVLSSKVWLAIGVASALFASCSRLFIGATRFVANLSQQFIKPDWMRPFVGGVILIGLTLSVHSRDYNGLSLGLISQSFTPQGVLLGAFALKILFTAVTLGTGFKGGEVTPLFCIGATSGAAFAQITGQPTAFFAALGFVAIFAGAANTPLASTLLGIELFGAQMAVPIAAACIISYILSGHRGIYQSQQIHTTKSQSVQISQGLELRKVGLDSLKIHRHGIGRILARRRKNR